MKRKVIQIADSTQLVSLPRKWAQSMGIKKGDEIEITENGNRLMISAGDSKKLDNIGVDITGLDRDSFMFFLRSLYEDGYDEIKVIFKNPTANHYRLNKKVQVLSALRKEVDRINGFELIEQKEDYCLIKAISENSILEFDSVLKRIFLLILNSSDNLSKASKEKNKILLESVNDIHNTVTKFIAFELRLLNKKGYSNSKKSNILYNIISYLDLMMDVIKDCSRWVLKTELNLSKETLKIISLSSELINLFYDFYYKFSLKKVEPISRKRYGLINIIESSTLKPTETHILATSKQIADIILHLTVARMTLEHTY